MSEYVMVKRELLEKSVSMPRNNAEFQAQVLVIEELRAVLAQEAGKCEPVAWLVQWNSILPGITGHREVVLAEPSFSQGSATVAALYTSPPAPVSEEMVDLLRRVVESGALLFNSQPDFEALEVEIHTCLEKQKAIKSPL